MTNLEPVRALNWEMPQQMSFIRYFKNMPTKSSITVRIFNHSDFYSVHGEDASLAAQQVFKTDAVKLMGEVPKLSYLCLSQKNFERFVRDLLLIKQYRVEVYVKPSQSKNNDWVLEYKGSPGNLQQFENMLYEVDDIVINAAVMAVKLIGANKLGVSCVNSTESTFSVTEFSDNEFYTVLEALVAQLSPKECVIPLGEGLELVNLRKMLERNSVIVIKTKKTDFNTEDAIQALNRLLFFSKDQQRNALALSETNKTEAISGLNAIIKYLNLTGDEENFNQYKLTSLDAMSYVRLDNAAISALDVVGKPGETSSYKHNTVYNLLNNCSTQQGKRVLERWLKQPLRDLKVLTERLDVVEALMKDSEARNILSRYWLTKVPDLLGLAKKLGSKKASLQDCYKVYQAVDSIPGLIVILRKIETVSIKALLIDPIGDTLTDMERYQSMIEQTMDLDLVDRGNYFIKPTHDDSLNDLHLQRNSLEEKMQTHFQSAADDLGFDSGKNMKLECTDQFGYFFRVTIKDEPTLRKNKNYQILGAITGGVRFTTDRLTSLNEKYSEVTTAYEIQQGHAVQEVLGVAAGYADAIRNLNMCIGVVDVLVSFASASISAPIPYVRPQLLEEGSGVLRLKQARHPCLERQDGCSFIPNDIEFIKDEKVVHIITGPNMGGKSTFMRTVGVNVLLAHIGCFVACEEAEISLVDGILTRVGADDSELKGLSTFMMEMVESCGILRSGTSNSLVLMDELGRGTSTYDGCGIAWAIAEYLANDMKAFSLFATHYHHITRLEIENPTVNNLHVTAIVDDKKMTPLYQIQDGICDRSYGIQCARAAGFPEDLLEFAINHQEKLDLARGMKYIKDLEFSLKRRTIDEGDAIIDSVLTDCQKMDVDKLTDEELMEQVNRIKTTLGNSNNLFIKGLIE